MCLHGQVCRGSGQGRISNRSAIGVPPDSGYVLLQVGKRWWDVTPSQSLLCLADSRGEVCLLRGVGTLRPRAEKGDSPTWWSSLWSIFLIFSLIFSNSLSLSDTLWKNFLVSSPSSFIYFSNCMHFGIHLYYCFLFQSFNLYIHYMKSGLIGCL